KSFPKQINVSIQKPLYDKVCEHVEEYGYKNIQDFLTELARREVFEKKGEIDESVFDNMEVREEYADFLLNLKESDFLSEEESRKSLEDLRRRAKAWEKENQ